MEGHGARKYPIDAEAVLGPTVRETEFRVMLPEGWKAQLPEGVTAVSPFGTVRTEYSQVGRELVIRRYSAGARGIHAPEKVADLIAWMKKLASDDMKFIVLSTPGAETGGVAGTATALRLSGRVARETPAAPRDDRSWRGSPSASLRG